MGKRTDAYRFWWENLSEREPFAFIRVHCRKIVKWIFKKEDGEGGGGWGNALDSSSSG
jgi:hypothetical protein